VVSRTQPYPADGIVVEKTAPHPDEVTEMTCTHQPACPPADRHDARAACIVADHWEQGWALLCNGTLVFDDGGVLAPPSLSAA
jgi:hypothetical protein